VFQNCTPVSGGGSSCWTYSANPAQILYSTTLPLPNAENINKATLPKTTHDAAWWAAKTKGMDFSKEDLNDPATFNRIIWKGMMGNKPYPTTRSGANLRSGGTPQAESREKKSQASETGHAAHVKDDD